jgi:aspartyl-tRNA(Asn)/glutamyl-tRNA(Gln) amidotransferase subunit A
MTGFVADADGRTACVGSVRDGRPRPHATQHRAVRELTDCSLEELVKLLGQRSVRAVEVVRAHLERAAAHEALGAFITLDAEGALAAAANADEALAAGRPPKALHAVPMAVKDMIATRGLVTTGGSEALHDWVPTQDAAVVAAVRDAGGIVLGKTHTTEFAVWATGGHPRYSTARNPWDPSRVPGGSSTGSAIAVAAGLAPAALGTDTGGSSRIPAALCGVVGFKPTRGAVSTAGVIPLSPSLDHIGVLANTVRDVAAVFRVIRNDRPTRRPPERLDLKEVRIGVLTPSSEPHGDVKTALDEACVVLRRLGAELRSASVPDLDDAYELSRAIQYPELSAYHEAGVRERPEAYGEGLRRGFAEGAAVTATSRARALNGIAVLRTRLDEALVMHEVLVLPTVGFGAPRIGQDEIRFGGRRQAVSTALSEYTRAFNVSGHPAVSVPCGFTQDGLPIGMQLVGRGGGDYALLEIAHAYEQASGWHAAAASLATNPRRGTTACTT